MLASRRVFRVFAARKLKAFFGSREHAKLAELAGALPFATQAHGLELRLTAGADHADYLICLDSARETIHSVREFVSAKERAGSSLSRVETFLRAWSGASSAQRRHFPQLWLEWDRPEGEATGAPGLFLAPARPEAPASKVALRRALRTLYPPPAARRHEAWIARVAELLPAGARLRHFGAMPGRDPGFLRLVLEDVPPEGLSPLLRQVGWPGNMAALDRLLSETASRTGCRPTLIDLDFLEEPTPALGLEYLLVGDHPPADGGASLIDYLLEKDLASPEKARALGRWLTWDVREPGGEEQGALWAKLYHIKLSLSGGPSPPAAPVLAKAYLGFFGGPSRRGLQAMQTALRHRLLLQTSNPSEA